MKLLKKATEVKKRAENIIEGAVEGAKKGAKKKP